MAYPGSARLGLRAILPDLFLCKVGHMKSKDLIAYIHLKYDFAPLLKRNLLQKKRIYSPFHKGLDVFEGKQEATKAIAPLLQNDRKITRYIHTPYVYPYVKCYFPILPSRVQ